MNQNDDRDDRNVVTAEVSADPLQGWDRRFEECRRRTDRSRLSKLLRSPLSTLYRHGLSLAARRFDLEIRRRVRTFWGEEMTVVLPDGISHFLYCNRFFEETSTRWLLQHLKPGQVFLDVGAHFGYFTLLAASIVGDTGSVHAFEPTPGSCRMLRENAASHRNVAIREAALWRQDCQLPFKDYGLRFSGLNSFTSPRISDSVRRLEPRQPEDRQRDILVRAIRGDDYVENAGIVPDLVKIDTEGAELAILEGLSRTLRKSRPLLIVEVEDDDASGRVSSRQVVDFLSGLGYRVLEDPDRTLNAVEAASSQNVLFAPQSSNRTGGTPNRNPSDKDRS